MGVWGLTSQLTRAKMAQHVAMLDTPKITEKCVEQHELIGFA